MRLAIDGSALQLYEFAMERITLAMVRNLRKNDEGHCALLTWFEPNLWGMSCYGSVECFKKIFIKYRVKKVNVASNGKIQFTLYFPAMNKSIKMDSSSFLKDRLVQEFYFFKDVVLPEGSTVLSEVPTDEVLFSTPTAAVGKSKNNEVEILRKMVPSPAHSVAVTAVKGASDLFLFTGRKSPPKATVPPPSFGISASEKIKQLRAKELPPCAPEIVPSSGDTPPPPVPLKSFSICECF